MKKRSWVVQCRAILCIILCLAMVVPFAGCKKNDVQDNADGTENVSAMVINDADDAIEQLADLGENAGYSNALSELTKKSTATIDGDKYYRLQQNYQGIPVYGRTVVCATDEDGNVTSVTGNALDVDADINLMPTVTQEKAEASIKEYLAKELGYDNTDWLTIDELTTSDLVIYCLGGSDAILAYCLNVGIYELTLDAHNAEVVRCIQTLFSSRTNESNNRNNSSSYGWQDTDGTYVLRDAERNIYIYDAGNQTYWDVDSGNIDPNVLTLVRSNDSIFGNEDDNTTTSSTAVSYLNVLTTVYDFYAINLQETGYGVLAGIYNDALGRYEGNNAGGGIVSVNSALPSSPPDYDSANYSGGIGAIIAGTVFSDNFEDAIDTFGHEYTHFVTSKYVDWSYSCTVNDDAVIYNGNLEAGAINEALSDIFGELIQGEVSNKIDWVHGDRDMRAPSINGYPELVNEIELHENGWLPVGSSATDYSHGYSTVISHAAYLMWNGIDGDESKMISTDDLSKLWYRAMLMMPSDCNFATCRKLVEWAAMSIDGLTKEHLECISEAFDAVGIMAETSSAEILLNCDRNITAGDKLLVYDVEGNLHERYTLRISGTVAENKLAYTDTILSDLGWRYDKTFTITEAQELDLELPNGYYTFMVSDSNNPNYSYTFTVSVSDEGADGDIELHTEFVDQLIVKIPNGTEPEQEKLLTQINRYNQYGKLEKETIFQYNENGLLTSVVDREISTTGNVLHEATIPFTFDGEGRLLEIGDANSDYYSYDTAGYTYNTSGQLISSYLFSGGGGSCKYEYDSLGKLTKCIENMGDGFGTIETDFFYDSTGVLIEARETSTYMWGEEPLIEVITYTYSCDEQGRITEISSSSETTRYYNDYRLFTVEEHTSITSSYSYTTAHLTDIMGHTIWTLPFSDAEITADEDGYMLSAKVDMYSESVTYEFYYDGEQPSISTKETENEPVANEHNYNVSGPLTYPISEEACYIIYKNWNGGELDESEYAAVTKRYSPDSEYAYFMLGFYRSDFTASGIPDWYFQIDLNTGECMAGPPGSPPRTFNAEDYYY